MTTTDPEFAARRVLEFLRVRSTHGGMDPELLAGVAGPDELYDLATRDVEALVRHVLGDVPTRVGPRRPSGPTLPAGMTWAEAHRREAAGYSNAPDEETRWPPTLLRATL